jgi:hypothetical protein
LFFKKKDLDLAIGLSLTIMLVMYTMYQSISQVLPATAYLKFIDIWLMFCLMVPFFVFVLQVFMKVELLRKFNNSENENWVETKISDRAIKVVLFVVPVLTILFMFLYLCFAIHFYSNP